MKRNIFCTTVLMLVSSSFGYAQLENDTNEGSRLIHDSLNDAYTFEWWGNSGRTYFVQISENLQQWQYLDLIKSGTGEPVQIGFMTTSDKLFTRLQYADYSTVNPELDDFDGDGISNIDEITMFPVQGNPLDASSKDGDTIPDDWERFYGLNWLLDDSTEDPDMDGASNLNEFLSLTNPLDYYNGDDPVIEILIGQQDVEVNCFTEYAFELLIKDSEGHPLPNAPAQMTVLNGTAVLSNSNHTSDNLNVSIDFQTNVSGKLHPAFTSVYLYAGSTVGIEYTIRVTAGGAVADFNVSVINSVTPAIAYPQKVERTVEPDGDIRYRWSGNLSLVESVIIEEQDENGEWIQVYNEVASSVFLEDAANEIYSVVLSAN